MLLQAYEVWKSNGDWVSQHHPNFGPGISDRFKIAESITEEQCTAADAKRRLISQHMQQLLGGDGVLALPSAPGPAVLLNTPADQLDEWRKSLLSLTCIGGLAGLPQVRLMRLMTDQCMQCSQTGLSLWVQPTPTQGA